MQQYLVVIEKTANNYSAFLPDVPGCIATGQTVDETLQLLQEALTFHLEGILEDGATAPEARDLRTHLDLGTFNPEHIGANYLIANISVEIPKLAA